MCGVTLCDISPPPPPLVVSSMSMTVDFVEAFQSLYKDMDPETSVKFARSFLFDIARIAGRSDCKRIVQSSATVLDNLQAKIGMTVWWVFVISLKFHPLPPALHCDTFSFWPSSLRLFWVGSRGTSGGGYQPGELPLYLLPPSFF